MPIIDYRCRHCQTIDSHFVPSSQCGSDHPKTEFSRCSKCRHKSDRVYDTYTPTIGFTAKSGKSIVVHLNTSTGEYSIPGNRDDELPGPGYKRVDITSMKHYERLCKSVNASELEKARFKQEIEREYFDSTSKSHRESQKQAIEKAISNGGHWVQHTDEKGITRTRWAPITPRALQLFDAACARADKRRDEMRRSRAAESPNFHSRILEHRESERSVVDGAAKRPNLPDIRDLLSKYRRG